MRILIQWVTRLIRVDQTPAEIKQAQQLIQAIDAGGIPLNPAKVRQIAENLGLEVSRKASTEDTIQRIRAALSRY